MSKRRIFSKIYQFKITLKEIKPPIWRRIQVPETYSFWDLHVAIQDAMGWGDYHLHEFEIYNPHTKRKEIIATPDEDTDIFTYLRMNLEFKERISRWFSMENKSAIYIYDFGDYWVHEIKLEKILPQNKEIQYPVCIKGRGACPPEDIGGVEEYQKLLDAFKNGDFKKLQKEFEWMEDDFNPFYFNPDDVIFDDPDERWREIYLY